MNQWNMTLPAILPRPPTAEIWLKRILSPIHTEEGCIDCEFIRAPIESLLDLHAEMGNLEDEKIFEFRALVSACLLRNWDSHFELDLDDGDRLMERVESAMLKLSPECKRAMRYVRDDSNEGRLFHVIELTQLPSGHPQELEVQGWPEWNSDLSRCNMLSSPKSRQRLERRIFPGSVEYRLLNIEDSGAQGGRMND